MKTKGVYVVTMGALALGAIIATVVAGDRGISSAISGLVAIAAMAVGALATIAHDFNNNREKETKTYVASPPPAHGWPTPARGWEDVETERHDKPEEKHGA